MQFPAMRGIIDRRILANFRVDPDVLAKVLPCPFRPKLVNGKGIAGICLIRLKQIRPRFVPAFMGISSENAAHRIAVEWARVWGHSTLVSRTRRLEGARVWGHSTLVSRTRRLEGTGQLNSATSFGEIPYGCVVSNSPFS